MPNAIYSQKRTYVVQNINNNYLVRGNEPLNEDGSFAYEAIATKLKDTIGNDFDLTKYKFIDLSIIDNTPGSERGDLELEFVSFGLTSQEFDSTFPASIWPPYSHGLDLTKQYGTKVYGNTGSFMWWPVQGCSDATNCAQVETPLFGFSKLVDHLNFMMNNEKDTVIYYHCEHGHDRTSALSGAYMLKYMGMDLNDVLTKRPPDGAKAFTHAWSPEYEELVKYYASTL